MNRLKFEHLKLPTGRAERWGKVLATSSLGFTLAFWALAMWQLCRPGSLPLPTGLAEAALLVLAVLATLLSLGRQLPAQNVLLVTAVAGLGTTAAHALSLYTAIPFGPYEKTGPVSHPQMPAGLWAMPLLWVLALLNSRGVARLMLRWRRSSPRYGYWVMGVTVLLVLAFDLGLEPFATSRHYWEWSRTKFPLDWYGTPLVNFLGWCVTALVILGFVTPSLINKLPRPQPPDFTPLCVYTAAQLLFMSQSIHQGFRAATAVSAGVVVLTVVLSIAGGQRRRKY